MDELKRTFKNIEERLNAIESTLQEFRYLRKTSYVYENESMDYKKILKKNSEFLRNFLKCSTFYKFLCSIS